jgi:outer membrane protein assembly factor BamB
MRKINVLCILSNGRVAAINKKDGTIIWEVKLGQYAGSNMMKSIGQIAVEGNSVYVGCAGILLCLNIKDGSLIWKNELKGWGYNFISMANANSEAAAAAAVAAASAAVVAATA